MNRFDSSEVKNKSNYAMWINDNSPSIILVYPLLQIKNKSSFNALKGHIHTFFGLKIKVLNQGIEGKQ